MFLLLLGLWIIFNGRFTLEILLFGIVISAAVCFFCVRLMGYSFRKEFSLLKKLPSFIVYLFVLLWEILKANICVIRITLFKARKIDPVIVRFNVNLKSGLARTILANSITLTPGTITVSCRENEFVVHCLDRSLAEGLESSDFVKRLERMEA